MGFWQYIMKRQTMSSSSSDSLGVGALRMIVENDDQHVKRYKPTLSHSNSNKSTSDDDAIDNKLRQTSNIVVVDLPEDIKPKRQRPKTVVKKPANKRPQLRAKPQQNKIVTPPQDKVMTPQQYENIRQQNKVAIQQHHLNIQTDASKQDLYNELKLLETKSLTPDEQQQHRLVIEEQLFKYIKYADIKTNKFREQIIVRNYYKKLLDMYNQAKFIINSNIDPLLLRLGPRYITELDDLQSRIDSEIMNKKNYSQIRLYNPIIVKIRQFERRCDILYQLVYPGLNVK